MLCKLTKEMTSAEKLAAENSNNQFLLSIIHPVGGIWVGGKDDEGNLINPSELFGGTWELIDKEFATFATILTDDTTTDTYSGALSYINPYYVTKIQTAYMIAGHTVRFRITVYPTKGCVFDDTDIELFKIIFSNFGFTSMSIGYSSIVAVSDGFDQALLFRLGYTTTYENGVEVGASLKHNAVLGSPKTITITDTISQTGIGLDFTVPLLHEYMLDEFCDKFYWKRIK